MLYLTTCVYRSRTQDISALRATILQRSETQLHLHYFKSSIHYLNYSNQVLKRTEMQNNAVHNFDIT